MRLACEESEMVQSQRQRPDLRCKRSRICLKALARMRDQNLKSHSRLFSLQLYKAADLYFVAEMLMLSSHDSERDHKASLEEIASRLARPHLISHTRAMPR
jgi:hypothetical protein